MTRSVEFEFRVPSDHPSLAGHFPQRPIVPAVLLLDHVLSMFRQVTGRRIIGLQQVKLVAAMRPMELAHAHCMIDAGSASFRATVRRDGATVTLAVGSLMLASDHETFT